MMRAARKNAQSRRGGDLWIPVGPVSLTVALRLGHMKDLILHGRESEKRKEREREREREIKRGRERKRTKERKKEDHVGRGNSGGEPQVGAQEGDPSAESRGKGQHVFRI